MAEAVLFNIAQQLLNNMSSAAIEEAATAWGYKTQLAKLNNTINIIKDVLLDAEQRQPNSHAIQGWLQRLRVAVYDADDLFDEITSLSTQKEACLFFSKINQLHVGSIMGRKINNMREMLDGIANDGGNFGFRLLVDEERVMGRRKREQSCSFVREEDIVGRDSDKVAILEMLLNENVEESVYVIPVVGIGGLGKTTLAQLVYNDEKVENQFELRLWVCVSDVFDIRVIVEKIITSATCVKPGDLEMEQLQRQLRNVIGGKRYLLVLDDVWNEDREEWLKLRALLFCGGPGCKVLVTTRSRQVAGIMATGSCYDLRHLSEAESWFLFCKMAFESGQEDKDLKLVEIGKQIVKKCANVPLAIRTVGGLLYARDERRWLAFKDNELAKIRETENSIMPILKLSYNHLQSSLKHCFAYCALFPKDYVLEKDRLISLWIAEGFVVPSCERQSLEDAGEECFMDLVQKCFFQDLTKDALGDVKSCKIHDLMHDLALKEAGGESVIFTSDLRNVNENTHHLSAGFNLTSLWEIPSCFLELNRLRTFLLPEQATLGTRIKKSVSEQLTSNFRRLRVLDLHGLGIENLSNSIGDLIHLRYLDISFNSHIKALPNSVSRLQNLQVLRLSKCYRLRKLPTDIKRLVNLRCLELDDCDALTHMPAGMGRLTALRKLNKFVVGNDSGAFNLKGCAQLRDLSSLNNISGDLQILLQGKWKYALSEAKVANLCNKLHLSELVIDFFEANCMYHEPLFEGLQPNPNIKSLAITYYAGQSFPSWARLDKLNTFLPNLVDINISNCNRCKCLPSFSQLLCLKRLHITYAHSVEYMDNTGLHLSPSVFFPSLEELILDRMGNLRGWWRQADGNHDVIDVTAASYQQDIEALPCFPRLSKLQLRNCAKLRMMPLFPHVEELKLVNVDEDLSLRKAVENFTAAPRSLLSSRLKTLEIDNIDHFISLPKEHLKNLSTLGLWQCSKLVDLSGLGEGLRNLPSLRTLTFFHCDQLTSLCGGLQHLTSLQELLIRKCKELIMLDEEEENGMPWKALRMLRCLRLRYIPKMAALPQGLQHVTSLRFLEIVGCDGLTTLPDWISCLSLLQWLSIRECSKLMELPEGFVHLSKLKELEITACPRLTRRCRRPQGAFSSRSSGRFSTRGRFSTTPAPHYGVARRPRWRVDNKLKELGWYLPLYKAALTGRWKDARKIIDEDPEALTSKISIASETALHIAVGTGTDLPFVEKLVKNMSPEELSLTDQNGETALSVAAIVGNIEAAKLLVSKNPDLPNIASKSGLPLHRAAQYGHKLMISFLWDCTRKDMDPGPFSGEYGAKLLIYLIHAEFYGLALNLFDMNRNLATMELNEVGSPLSVLAEKPNAFPSGSDFKFWPHALNPVSYWNYVRNKKMRHHQAIELVKRFCEEIMELDDAKAFSMLQEPLHLAAKLGIHEIIEEIVVTFPPAIWSSNEENHNVFQLAVTYRRENVFNLIYQMSEYRHLVTRYIDPHGNNILHLAGRLPPSDRLNLVSGAALQMQRELQWFKQVEKFVQPAYKTWKNAEGKTPALLFSEAHQDLVKEGEKWMKDTATSCTVAAALIATVVFAAAITVPGGNDQNSGIPLYIKPENHHQRAFAVFGVFDAVSLFSSVTSILMFLSILTSRYAEADFLYSLPKRLIIGLSMLFISITSLMVAFSSALYLVFGQNKVWRLLLVGGLASLPVTLFIFLQFPLLLDIMLATYGRGIFLKKSNRMLH